MGVQMDQTRDSVLDRPIARVFAGGVILAVIATLLAIHWGDLFPPEVTAADDPAAACIAQRTAEVEQMVADNPQMADRKQLFIERAAAICIATNEGAGGPPPLPR